MTTNSPCSGPPWLDEALQIAGATDRPWPYRDKIIAALLFAALQPRPITEAMVEAAAKEIYPDWSFHGHLRIARTALEAAENASEK